jgi:hypothetical protein
MRILAVNYHLKGSPKEKTQGAWKQFDTNMEAASWLGWRKNKTPDSPKGGIIFNSEEELKTFLEFGFKDQSVSLQIAMNAYVKWSKL